MYKKVWLGLLTAAMVAGLTACGSKAAEETTAKAAGDSVDGEVTIHLMMSNSQELGVSAAVEAFNKAYEGKIKCEADYVAFNDVFETLEDVSRCYDHRRNLQRPVLRCTNGQFIHRTLL